MMYLLDTHTLLWALKNSPELPESDGNLIERSSGVATSIVCFWELAIKSSIGKLRLEFSIRQIEELCIEKDIRILPITTTDLEILKTLPDIHKDPFDRMLVCQAIGNGAIIITKDQNITKYPVRTLW